MGVARANPRGGGESEADAEELAGLGNLHTALCTPGRMYAYACMCAHVREKVAHPPAG